MGFTKERQRTTYFNDKIKNLRTPVPDIKIEATPDPEIFLIKVNNFPDDSKDWIEGYNIILRREEEEKFLNFETNNQYMLSDLKLHDTFRVIYRGLSETDIGNSSKEIKVTSITPLETVLTEVPLKYKPVENTKAKSSKWFYKICFNYPWQYSPDHELITEPVRTV